MGLITPRKELPELLRRVDPRIRGRFYFPPMSAWPIPTATQQCLGVEVEVAEPG